ncbi:MAG: DUF4340 domain-containing protein [Cyclobacteriaceae bacterium]
MKNNTTRLLIVLAVLIGVFAIVKLTRNNSRSTSFRTELVNFSVEEADKIEISSLTEHVQLTKSEGTWSVETDQGVKAAMEANVRSLLSTLNTIRPSRLAARSSSKWKDFSVDSTGTKVRVYGKGKTLTDIVLGRFGVEGQRSFYTYVRLSEDEDVYVAAEFMKMSISTSVNDFRNNVMARMNKDSITEISFNYPDSSLVIRKADELWMKNDSVADSAAVAGYLNTLNLVSSRNFTAPPATSKPDLHITYRFANGSEKQLSAYKEVVGWTIISSENKEEVWNDENLFEKIFVASSQF